MAKVPTIKSILYVGLSVRDARRSAEWWQQLLRMEVEKENFNQEHWPAPWNEVQLIHARRGFQLGFIEHPQVSGEQFSEFGTGLDHIEFEVSSHEELEQWRDRLDALGISHSGIKDDHLIVVRDPDNIQFEFFLPLPRADGAELPGA